MYLTRLKEHTCSCTDDVINMCKDYLPKEYAAKPWINPDLRHGVNLLDNTEALDCYMAAYGEMHLTKCRVALQNLPFDKINGTIEIIDWGCGQGIGSMSILDSLKDRDLLQWLKKVTLIEPSSSALSRAEQNILYLTHNCVEVNPINKYLPSDNHLNDNVLENIGYQYSFIIHCFSNILDVTNIDLCKMARLVASTKGTHFVLCTGPLNSQAYRIKQFCSIFGEQDFFSCVESPYFARTVTGHPFTCLTRSFVYNGKQLNFDNMNTIRSNGEPIYTDYDLELQIQNKMLSLPKARVMYRLQQILFEDDLIYYNCEINETVIDFLIIRPKIGILLLNVFEEDLLDFWEDTEDDEKSDAPNRKYQLTNTTDGTQLQSPLALINNCQSNVKDCIEELLICTIEKSKNFNLIKKVIVFANNTDAEVSEFFKACNEKYTALYGNEFIKKYSHAKDLYSNLNLEHRQSAFTDIIQNKLIKLASPQWHSYRQGKRGINLTSDQKKLCISRPIQQKISGVAGSGKTQVMVTRAINAQKRLGGDILILTFNITLVNYLASRINEIREDFCWNKIHIYHYHHFFRLISSKYSLHVDKLSYNDETFFENVKDKLISYKAIFIDEVQDYNTPWLKILQNYFLDDEGEFVVFGDPKQNVYQRPTDSNGDVRLGVIKGEWNKSLKKGKRFTNPLLGQLAMDFQKTFMDELTVDCIETDRESNGNLNFNILTYLDLRTGINFQELVKQCIACIRDSGLRPQDFAILSSTTQFLREFDYQYKSLTNEKTETSFITKKQYERLKQIHGIKDDKGLFNWKFQRDFDALDRNKKYKFTTDSKLIKISTIQSFKGWESPAVILIIDKETEMNSDYIACSPELIYTALTRARETLYIFNFNNSYYHEFFNSF